jgi:hypothetical protein
MCVESSNADCRGVLMMLLMYLTVEPLVVQESMTHVKTEVVNNSEHDELPA